MKVLKSYKINKLTEEEMKKVCEKLGITQNAFVEIAIIEKLTRISRNQAKIIVKVQLYYFSYK